jgi:hypothetical protein
VADVKPQDQVQTPKAFTHLVHALAFHVPLRLQQTNDAAAAMLRAVAQARRSA